VWRILRESDAVYDYRNRVGVRDTASVVFARDSRNKCNAHNI
jgi:hypothetical protein